MAAEGLKRGATYRLSYQERTQLDAVATGGALMDVGLTVAGMDGAEASEVVWLDEVTGP
jgi:hypothetical protein